MTAEEMNFYSTTILGITGVIITSLYSWRAQQISKDQLFKELYTEFNSRYNGLNDDLNYLTKKNIYNINTLTSEERNKYMKVLNDYFILCSEEFYWKKKNRIDKKVWRCWCIGMNYYFTNCPAIKRAWKEELANGGYKSHYLDNENELFNEFQKYK